MHDFFPREFGKALRLMNIISDDVNDADDNGDLIVIYVDREC